MNKEQAYDEKIFSLMAQIIAVCKEHKIAMVASFAIPTEEDANLRCTSTVLTDDTAAPREFFEAKDLLYQGRGTASFSYTVKGPDGKVKEMGVVIP